MIIILRFANKVWLDRIFLVSVSEPSPELRPFLFPMYCVILSYAWPKVCCLEPWFLHSDSSCVWCLVLLLPWSLSSVHFPCLKSATGALSAMFPAWFLLLWNLLMDLSRTKHQKILSPPLYIVSNLSQMNRAPLPGSKLFLQSAPTSSIPRHLLCIFTGYLFCEQDFKWPMKLISSNKSPLFYCCSIKITYITISF